MDPYEWSWNAEALTVVLALTLGYVWALRRFPAPRWRLACFLGAMLLVLAVTITPIDTIALHYLLSMHLVQNVVLAVHSGAGASGYGASDRVPELIAAMVYVDSAPAKGALDPGLTGVELPMPSLEQLAADENLDGLTEEQLEAFRQRAVPEPAGAVREGAELTNDARLDVPSTVICTGFTSEQVKAWAVEGYAWLGGLIELRDVTYVDLPTSHWPMWSRPWSSPGSSATSRRLMPPGSERYS